MKYYLIFNGLLQGAKALRADSSNDHVGSSKELDKLRPQLRQARFDGDHIREDRILHEIKKQTEVEVSWNQSSSASSVPHGDDALENVSDSGASIWSLSSSIPASRTSSSVRRQASREPDEREIDLVMSQANCSHLDAENALVSCSNDIVEAIMLIQSEIGNQSDVEVSDTSIMDKSSMTTNEQKMNHANQLLPQESRPRTDSVSSTSTFFSTIMESLTFSKSNDQSATKLDSSKDDMNQSSSAEARPRSSSNSSASSFFTAIMSPFTSLTADVQKKNSEKDTKSDGAYRNRFSFESDSVSESSATDSSYRPASHMTAVSSHDARSFKLSHLGTSLMYDMMFGGQGELGQEHRALFMAVEEGNMVVVQHFLVGHPDFASVKINQRNQDGQTLLHCAASKGQLEVVGKFLSISNLDVNKRNGNGHTAAHVAIMSGYFEVAKKLFDFGAKINQDEFDSRDDFLLVQQLVAGRDVNEENGKGETLLRLACRDGDIDRVRILLSVANVDVNKSDKRGWTPLYAASLCGHVEVVQKLLSAKNIEVNKSNNDGYTPLCAASSWGPVEVIQKLLSAKNIEVNKSNNDGYTPLCVASSWGPVEVVEKLLSAKNIEVNKSNNSGSTPLYGASLCGHVEVVQKLLSAKNIEVNKSNNDGYTPLNTASRYGHVEVVTKLLSAKNIDINKKTDEGTTPLMIAKRNPYSSVSKRGKRYKEIVELLENHENISTTER